MKNIVKNIADYILNHKDSIHTPDAYLISSCKNYGKNRGKKLLPAAGQAEEAVREFTVRKDSFTGTFEEWEKEKRQEVGYFGLNRGNVTWDFNQKLYSIINSPTFLFPIF